MIYYLLLLLLLLFRNRGVLINQEAFFFIFFQDIITLFVFHVLISYEGDSLALLRAELKSQRKHVRSLEKKSLWSKILEEVAS